MTHERQPRAVVVTRPTVLEELLTRHGTREQARFFLEMREQSIDVIEADHLAVTGAVENVLRAIPIEWRRSRVTRGDLDRFLFEPDDIVLVVGQDGLVANTAKYLDDQPVLGVNPLSRKNEGVLVPCPPESVPDMLPTLARGRGQFQLRTMVQARLDDGQQLQAVNEIFIGHQSHQSARYRIHWEDRQEWQSSSGVIVSTGTGATGWAKSVSRERRASVALPQPDERRLVFFVREAWPGRRTGTDISSDSIIRNQQLRLVSRMDYGGTIFGDGIEADRIAFDWGRSVQLSLSDRHLRLVLP